MPPPSRLQNLLFQHQRLAHDLQSRGSPRRLLRLVPHLRRLLIPRRGQIWLLRGLQICLRRQNVPQRQQNRRLPRRVGVGGVPRGHRAVSIGGDQGEDADDYSSLRQHAAGRVGQGDGEGRDRRTIQGSVPAMGPADSLHDGEVRDV